MDADGIARLGILVSLGALAVGIAFALLGFGANVNAGPFALFALLGGLGVLLLGLVLIGGAAADAFSARLQGWRKMWKKGGP